jgi:hypothetical protein
MERVPCPIYVFRSPQFSPGGDTVLSAAPVDCVMAVYGGGGVVGEGGLAAAFGGAAVFRNETTGACLAGVWGARNASRFRGEMRARMNVLVVHETPDARLVFWGAEKQRPRRPRKD